MALQCYNCCGVELVIGREFTTCTTCSRTQPDCSYEGVEYTLLEEFNTQLSRGVESLISEIHDRYSVDRRSISIIRERMIKLKSFKCMFTQSELVFTLYYIALLEDMNHMSPLIYIERTGGVLSIKKLSQCQSYIVSRLRLDFISSPRTWSALLRFPLSQLEIVKSSHARGVEHICEIVHNSSNLSVHMVAAVAIVIYMTHQLKIERLQFTIERVHAVTQISSAALLKNYKKYKNHV